MSCAPMWGPDASSCAHDAIAELAVAHVSFNLRPGDRPVDEVVQELAETTLPHFPAPTAESTAAH
ncbi:hypothetical protein [Streptomyces sp. NPDC057375]|uniref:hypothetical protein n=1 Tax=Streptomyces sp. NPDC057375 TaxID=3346109 RepID=UPI0036325587